MKNGESGFTLVEVIVVVATLAVLLAIGTLQTSSWFAKKAVEDEAMKLYGELMAVRQTAMNMKKAKTMIIKGGSYQIYSSNVTTVGPIVNDRLKYPVMTASGVVPTGGYKVEFDERGYTSDSRSFCVEPGGDLLTLNSGTFDSVVVSNLRIKIGKRTAEGAACKDENNNIQIK